ncbi:hypothetical protein [Pseudomonas sp. BW7P1]|uniref:hypothetical protein n=1 Tax=Pseudomonas TaxID=286 RepID=UPI0021ADC88E|nr:hypothetical protein [Pseudomonas sp. BW7P1]UWI63934.1 hypothetical protein NWV16_11210 [Pseudomonas sp. BW7P1]
MSLLDAVTQICQRLAPGGWHSLMLAHGLDILAVPLKSELLKPLRIDRSVPGFEDFCPTGNRAIEPSRPAHSLLFHALASPRVTCDASGQPLQTYPTPAEVEAVLNYVFGVRPPTLKDLQRQAQGELLAVAVFASEYRCAPDTVHGEHADLCYSRTGIARVGNTNALYSPDLRCFLPFVEKDAHGIRIMPVRYSAYIAVQGQGNHEQFGPMDFQPDVDPATQFWVPIYKLFDGRECLAGQDLNVSFQDVQINEKIRHIHLRHSGSGWQEPDISQSPFVITEDLATLEVEPGSGSGLLLPRPTPRLVEQTHYRGQLLSFTMPRDSGGMIHGRSMLHDDGTIEDLNQREGVAELVKQGGYRALHYRDGTADGYIRAHCMSLEHLPSISAYSIIATPDFFPFCHPRRLMHWARQVPAFTDPNIWHARLQALSNVRYCANLTLTGQPFSPEDLGVTAIVGLPRKPGSPPLAGTHPVGIDRPATLPDGEAGLFGPGWGVGWVREQSPDGNWINCLAGYQMASPFPEDARICAALGSFWPGLAPDSARIFEPRASLHTIIPLTDAETGTGAVAWDNQPPPQLIQNQGRMFVRYRAYEYSDYTQVALENRFSLQQTGAITQQEYQNRVLSMYRVYNVLGAGTDKTLRNTWPLLSFRHVQRLDPELDSAQQQVGIALRGWVFRFLMYERGTESTPAEDFRWRDVQVKQQVRLFVSAEAILVKHENATWQLALEAL